MQKIIDTIESFKLEDMSVFKTVLHNQFQKHFNFLVEQISSIEKIEVSFFQVDEDCYAMTNFILTKNNGYVYHYVFEDDNEEIYHWEFFKSEVAVINAFMIYLENSAYQSVSILGGGTLTFTKNPEI